MVEELDNLVQKRLKIIELKNEELRKNNYKYIPQ